MMKQKTRYIILFILGIAVLIKVAQLLLLTPLITNAFQGEAFGYLNELLNKHRLKDPDSRTLSYYISKATDYTNRFLIIYLAASLFIYWLWRYHKRTIKTFFTKPAPATNLAVFRIFFFGYLLYLGFPQKASAVSYLGQEAVVPPPGWHFILNHIPIEPLSIYFLGAVFKISCIFGLIGLYSRTAALFAAVSGLWIMGVPEFFGKVDHYHYLWQFLLILGFSRCGDALSVDMIIRSMKNPFRQFQQKSSAYRTPLVFIWITIGLIYFFPGLWKFVFSGFEWAFSDNLKYKMYSKWIELDNWAPFFRIDYYPWLYKPAALSVILFELSFIFALPFRISRIIFIWGGLIFHSMTWLFMKISFAGLLVMYTSFINWDKLFKKAGRLFIKPVYLFYNTQNIYSVQIKNVVEQVDIFNAVTFKKASEKLNNTQSPITGSNAHFTLLLQLVLKVPLILAASPFIGLILVCHFGEIKSTYPKRLTQNIQANYSIIIVGLLVISLNCFTGLAIINSWPFSIYPTFASIETEYTSTIMMAAYDQSDNLKKQTIPLVSSNNSFVTHFQSKSRLRGFIGHILNRNQPNNQNYELLLNLWLNRDQNFQTIQSVKFYQIRLSMNPDKEYKDYKLNQLLYQKEL